MNARVTLLLLLIHPETANASSSSQMTSPLSALDQAQALKPPLVNSTMGGEFEHLEFWHQHERLFRKAWVEWEELQRETNYLPGLSERLVMKPNFAKQINQLRENPDSEKETKLREDFWSELLPGVFASNHFFSQSGIKNIRTHLTAATHSGIPMRRPNGMNRYGLVLDNETDGGVSYSEVDGFQSWLTDKYIRPLGRMFFADYIASPEDDESSYAFTIHYKDPTSGSSDIQLKEHSDASVVTLNINLNLQEDGEYEGSELVFWDKASKQHHKVRLEPGMVLLHRGIHRHQTLPIRKGERYQLIVWLFGKEGYVRFAPYEKDELMSLTERWSTKQRNRETLTEHLEL
jgi:hypothetical protein